MNKVTFSISGRQIKTSEFLFMVVPVAFAYLLLIFLIVDGYTSKIITIYTAGLIVVLNSMLCFMSWIQLNHLEQKYGFKRKKKELEE